MTKLTMTYEGKSHADKGEITLAGLAIPAPGAFSAMIARPQVFRVGMLALIEQTFASEEPATWRAAAEAIAALRKLEPGIKLTAAKRIEELIARDPAKYGKFLAPLLLDGEKVRPSK
ncbi:hypothetical protein LLG95_08360 [bacterium]|nr:hypothetical protein [bacterium]